MKKILSAALALLLLLSFMPAVFAEDAGIGSFGVNPYGGEEDAMDTVLWYSASGKYHLFLPADVDLSMAKVYFTASVTQSMKRHVLYTDTQKGKCCYEKKIGQPAAGGSYDYYDVPAAPAHRPCGRGHADR